jgi:hypothetical protein
MTPSQIVIGKAESDHVSIEVASHSRDGWTRTKVRVASGIWEGSFYWEFHSGELRSFGEEVQQLYDKLSGIASLDPLEPNLTLRMTGDGHGHITVDGRADTEMHKRTYLVFTLALDQTELPAIIGSLMAADPGA